MWNVRFGTNELALSHQKTMKIRNSLLLVRMVSHDPTIESNDDFFAAAEAAFPPTSRPSTKNTNTSSQGDNETKIWTESEASMDNGSQEFEVLVVNKK